MMEICGRVRAYKLVVIMPMPVAVGQNVLRIHKSFRVRAEIIKHGQVALYGIVAGRGDTLCDAHPVREVP